MYRIITILLLVCGVAVSHAQDNRQAQQKAQDVAQNIGDALIDKPPFIKGIGAGFDLLGAGMNMFGSQGDYQGYVVVDILGKYIPVIEGGYGVADKKNDDTFVSYKAKGGFGRIGCDYNILRKKTDPYRFTLGLRYGFSHFNYDTTAPTDSTHTSFVTTSEKCTVQWIELAVGVNAKVWGPLRMGWSFRYRRRIGITDYINDPLYAPGFGNASGVANFMGIYTIGVEF